MPAAAVKVSYVLRIPPENMNHNAEFSLGQQTTYYFHRFPVPNNISLYFFVHIVSTISAVALPVQKALAMTFFAVSMTHAASTLSTRFTVSTRESKETQSFFLILSLNLSIFLIITGVVALPAEEALSMAILAGKRRLRHLRHQRYT